MRPLKLKLSAFGPYKGVTEIDMEKLGERGLYRCRQDHDFRCHYLRPIR